MNEGYFDYLVTKIKFVFTTKLELGLHNLGGNILFKVLHAVNSMF